MTHDSDSDSLCPAFCAQGSGEGGSGGMLQMTLLQDSEQTKEANDTNADGSDAESIASDELAAGGVVGRVQ